MQPELRSNQPVYQTGAGAIGLPQQRVLRNTYLLLAVTMIPTAIGALIGTSMNLLSLVRTSPALYVIGSLVIAYALMWGIEKNRDSGLGVGLLLAFTAYMGVLLGPLLQMTLGLNNGGQLIAMAAGGTAAVFFGLAGLATSTKRDFSGLGKFLFVGAIVLMLGVLANLFFQSPLMHLVIVGAFVIFSSLLIVWQINSIVRGGETNYISATLTLYVGIYNLFTSLLQLLGIFGGDRD